VSSDKTLGANCLNFQKFCKQGKEKWYRGCTKDEGLKQDDGGSTKKDDKDAGKKEEDDKDDKVEDDAGKKGDDSDEDSSKKDDIEKDCPCIGGTNKSGKNSWCYVSEFNKSLVDACKPHIRKGVKKASWF
jgi:hypothetical protein